MSRFPTRDAGVRQPVSQGIRILLRQPLSGRGRAVLAALREYIDSGPLARVEELVAAEVFNDLIAIARRLIDERQVAAAVAILGALLEDLLQRMARTRRLRFREHLDGLTALNDLLAGAHAYGAELRNRITQWAQIRADAAQVASESEARQMLAFVREFMADHLA
ncbi:MAG: hypothetical protein ACREQ4_09760 [Candidatus Binataceae bacterium]